MKKKASVNIQQTLMVKNLKTNLGLERICINESKTLSPTLYQVLKNLVFSAKLGIRQRCLLPPLLFNIVY